VTPLETQETRNVVAPDADAAMMTRERLIEQPASIDGRGGQPEWGSDVVADLLRALEIEYVSVMPGSTFRGLQDSLVNYTGNVCPTLILCTHENVAVGMARGYARVTGKPMAVVLHNVVGLLNGSMEIHDAWCDRVPMLVLGATGPVDAPKRRPTIDWLHTANVQGVLVRDFTKWDDQPASVEAMTEAILRGYKIACQDPPGPVYVCLDVGLQEQAVQPGYAIPDVSRYAPARPPEPARVDLEAAVAALLAAEYPVVYADRIGRDSAAVTALVELAELLALPVVDQGWGWRAFPSPHELDFAGMESTLIADADVVLGLDCTDLGSELHEAGSPTVINVSSDELLHRGLTTEYMTLPPADIPILASPAATMPLLLEACRAGLDDSCTARVGARRERLATMQSQLRSAQRALIEDNWDHPQITEARLAAELWEAIRDEDFVITMGNLRRQAPGVFTISGPEQDVNGDGSGAVGAMLTVALGASLGLKGSGRLPVSMIGDGEFLTASQALWTAARYEIPSLVVIINNRSFLNDEHHQERTAVKRDRPRANAWVAMRMEKPEVDFTSLARSLGVRGIGPVSEASALGSALSDAVQAVRGGACVVVDVWVENREVVL
jgi:thiamine pyrophosphate-dependent acetolactate synthase large subunit-like protein